MGQYDEYIHLYALLYDMKNMSDVSKIGTL